MMTDHPKAADLDSIASRARAAWETDAAKAGAAALRALAEFRPHHPQVVVGRRYASLIIPLAALDAAKAVLGDHDRGPVDVEALRALHDSDRQDDYELMGRRELRDKWGARL